MIYFRDTMAEKNEIEVNDDDCTVTLNNLTITLHPTIYQYLFGEKSSVKKGDRASVIEKALNVGLLAAQQGRVAQAVKLFNSEIAGEYDLLSTHMDVLQHNLEKDNKFKTDLEDDVVIALSAHCNEMGYDDIVLATGTEGEDGNKTGDALATIKIDSTKQTKIAIEVKFATNYSKGETQNVTAGNIRPKRDSVYSQILESQAVLDGSLGIFVIDEDLNPIDGPGIQYLPDIRGFIVKVNVLTGDYENLCMCYEVARQMAIAGRTEDSVDMALLQFLVSDLCTLLGRQKYLKDQGAEIVKSIKTNQAKTVKEVEKILIRFDSELKGLQEAMAWVQKCLTGLIETGELSAKDAFELYTQKGAQIDYDAKKKELQAFYEELGSE